MRIDLKGKASLLISLIALIFSGISFFQLQNDRKNRQLEERPRLGFSFSPYGFEERFGFYIKNVGGQRARIPLIRYTFNDLNFAIQAGELLKELNLRDEGAFRLIAGPGYILEPGEKKAIYTFSEKLNLRRQNLLEDYSKLLAADICYCSITYSECWTKRISRSTRQSAASDFMCDAKKLKHAA